MNSASIATILLISAQSSFAASTSLSCQWLKSPRHAENFYRPAIFAFTIDTGKDAARVSLIKDSFLYRTYQPCWIGGYSSCAFGFDYDRQSDWTIDEYGSSRLVIQAPSYYWSAELTLEFSQNIRDLTSGKKTSMRMSGDDGDGVTFKNEIFSCDVI